jgi:hypothetical protein
MRWGTPSLETLGRVCLVLRFDLSTSWNALWPPHPLQGACGWMICRHVAVRTPFGRWEAKLVAAVDDDGEPVEPRHLVSLLRLPFRTSDEVCEEPAGEMEAAADLLAQGFLRSCENEHIELVERTEREAERAIARMEGELAGAVLRGERALARWRRELRLGSVGGEAEAKLRADAARMESMLAQAQRVVRARVSALRDGAARFEASVHGALPLKARAERLWAVRWTTDPGADASEADNGMDVGADAVAQALRDRSLWFGPARTAARARRRYDAEPRLSAQQRARIDVMLANRERERLRASLEAAGRREPLPDAETGLHSPARPRAIVGARQAAGLRQQRDTLLRNLARRRSPLADHRVAPEVGQGPALEPAAAACAQEEARRLADEKRYALWRRQRLADPVAGLESRIDLSDRAAADFLDGTLPIRIEARPARAPVRREPRKPQFRAPIAHVLAWKDVLWRKARDERGPCALPGMGRTMPSGLNEAADGIAPLAPATEIIAPKAAPAPPDDGERWKLTFAEAFTRPLGPLPLDPLPLDPAPLLEVSQPGNSRAAAPHWFEEEPETGNGVLEAVLAGLGARTVTPALDTPAPDRTAAAVAAMPAPEARQAPPAVERRWSLDELRAARERARAAAAGAAASGAADGEAAEA